ncbi:TolC family protein [Clostridium beijerinckii]|uniref:TolC family protein n=1 Tax=Clostridium beijerinckii TaxID=1520 RepID=UPI000479E718|nr:TolC family protein [Clostridium beijerinckii]
MRKNINKIIAFAIGISVMSGGIVPALAADSTQQTAVSTSTTTNSQIVNGKPLITLDEAIKSAISISNTLAFDEQKISYQDKINDLNEKIDDNNGKTNSDKKDLDSDTADTTLKQVKQQRDFDEDKLIQKTTTAYNGIVTSQMKIDKATKDLEVKTKQLNDANLKKGLGIITATDLTNTQLQIESLQNSLKASKNALNDSIASFKVLTGKDVSQYSLEQDIKYDTFKIDGSVDGYLDNAIDNFEKYTEQLIKLNKDYLKDNEVKEPSKQAEVDVPSEPKFTSTSDAADISKYLTDYQNYQNALAASQAYAAGLSQRITYLNSKLGVYQNETNLTETKKKFKDQLRTFYTNLLSTEDSITTLKKNIELNNKQLSDAKLKYDLGMMTKSDYDALVVNSKDLEIQLRTLIDSYNTLKEEIQKPWIAFS